MAKVVLVGAGSVQFGCETIGDILNSSSLHGSDIVLYDINGEALQRVYQAAQAAVDRFGLEKVYKLSATVDRRQALTGADFVISSIEVGDRFRLWDQDRCIPQQYGIRQVYGENGGPGGLFHSLRIIPAILDICKDVEQLAPQAWVLNYSNPMSRICTTVHRAFPHMRFVGLCHEIASLEKHVPRLLGRPWQQLDLLAAGLNHFSCLLSARCREDGSDLYPEILQKAPSYFCSLPGCSDFLEEFLRSGNIEETEGWHELSFKGKAMRNYVERTLFLFILERFSLLPITTDSHFGEYLQWAFDEVDHRGIMDFYVYYRTVLSSRNLRPEIKLERRERSVAIIEALLGETSFIEPAVNLPNKGAIKELPDWLAVEVPAQISREGVVAQQISPLPKAYAGLLRNQVAIHDLTAEAVLSQSKRAVEQALLVDPVVTTSQNLQEMIEVFCSLQREFLGYLR